jgi:4-hydroxy-4-methyl-2-oxoglutarate aldolase
MLEQPPVLQIRRPTRRPPPEALSRLRGVATGFLVDCMDGRGALAPAVKPVDPARAAFAGVALPCLCGPGDNLAIVAALAFAGTDDVIVAAGDGFPGLAVVGDRVAGMARNRGAVAIVTDGMVRDTPGIREVGLPVFAGGVTPNSCASVGPGTIGEPVVVGGVAVEAGDILVGDCDGVVVVPFARIGAVLARLDAVRAAEAAMDARVAAGLDVPDRVRALLGSDAVRYLD